MSGQRFWTLLDRLLGAKVTVPFEVSQERFPDNGIITKGVVPGIPNWRRKAGGGSAVHQVLVLKVTSLHLLSPAHPQAFSDGPEQGPGL